jgi:FtsZ-binding cell division protein ZapB
MRPYEKMTKADLLGVIKALDVRLESLSKEQNDSFESVVKDLRKQIVKLQIENAELKKMHSLYFKDVVNN